MNCEYYKLYGLAGQCQNDPYAQITIAGDNGRVDAVVCEEHLRAIQSTMPSQETDHARAQREGVEE